MALPALATTDDVAAILNRSLTTAEVPIATRLIELASGTVRRYTRQDLTFTPGDVVTLPGSWGQTLVLPQRPVISVASVVLNGATSPYTPWTLIGDELFLSSGSFQPDYGNSLWGGRSLWGPAGSTLGPQATGSTWQGPQGTVTVTYDHGYVEIPDDIVNEVAGMAALQMSSPVGIDEERMGGYLAKYAQSPVGGMALADETKKILNYYRRRATSVSIATRR